MSLDFIAKNLETASNDFQGQVGAIVGQAKRLSSYQRTLGRVVIGLLVLTVGLSFVDVDTSNKMLAVCAFIWLVAELTKIRYEQVYSQIHGECVVYHLRCMSLVMIVSTLENYGIEMPAVFTDVDELIAVILKEDQ